jgi:hypothetical protein
VVEVVVLVVLVVVEVVELVVLVVVEVVVLVVLVVGGEVVVIISRLISHVGGTHIVFINDIKVKLGSESQHWAI